MINKDKLDNSNSDSSNKNLNNENINNKFDKDVCNSHTSDDCTVDSSDNNIDLKSNSVDDLQKELDSLNSKYNSILSDYEALKSNYDLVNEKLKNLLLHYDKLENNYETLKKDLKDHKIMQTNSARVKLVEQIFGLHDKLLLILDNNKDSNDENILLLKMINHEIESVYLDWQVEKYSQQVGDVYDVNMSKIVSTVLNDNSDMKNKISRIIYVGYKMNNKIIKMSEVEIFV